MKRAISSYHEDNSETAQSSREDTGLPQHPIYSNFSTHLWTTHVRLGNVQTLDSPRASTIWPRPPQVRRSSRHGF